jgi:hypothetical protein
MAKKATLIFLLLALGAGAVIWTVHTAEPEPNIRQTAAYGGCLNNLRLIDSAKQQWAEEHGKGTNASLTWDDLRPYIGRTSSGELPECPIHGVYTLGRVGEKARCSIHGTVPGP